MSNWRRRLPEAVVIAGIIFLLLIILALYGWLTGAWDAPLEGVWRWARKPKPLPGTGIKPSLLSDWDVSYRPALGVDEVWDTGGGGDVLVRNVYFIPPMSVTVIIRRL